MSITTIPDVTEFGGPKSDGYAEVDASKQLAAVAWNSLVTRLIAAFGAIGVDDGSTVGSLRAADLALDTRLDAIEAAGVQTLGSSTGTISATTKIARGTYASGNQTLTMPTATAGARFLLTKEGGTSDTLSVIRAGSDTVNGSTSAVALYNSTQTGAGALVFDCICTVTGAWTVIATYPAVLELLLTTVPALTTRVTALEAPTATTNSGSSSVSWTTVVEYLHTHTSLTTYTLNANTTQWPVGTARAISQYGTSTAGFQFAVPSGHKLNSVTNGVSGVLATAAADDGSPLQTFLVTRRASDEWTWA